LTGHIFLELFLLQRIIGRRFANAEALTKLSAGQKNSPQ
jgi:hypothetical protein